MKRKALIVAVWVCLIASATPTRAAQSIVGDVITRDTATGRVTVRAIRLTEPLRIDGRLDESLYSDANPASDFVQMEPEGGKGATEKTEVWVAFDQRNVYVSMRAWESRPERMIANEMRRDSNNIRQ